MQAVLLALVLAMLALVYWPKKYQLKLARKGPAGRKKAVKLGRNWFIKKDALERYAKSMAGLQPRGNLRAKCYFMHDFCA